MLLSLNRKTRFPSTDGEVEKTGRVGGARHITSYNNNLVAQRPTDKVALRQLHRHERLYKMMEDGAISKDNALWYYVDHFKGDRLRNIETLSNLVLEKERLQGPRSAEYSKAYLDDYFKGFEKKY